MSTRNFEIPTDESILEKFGEKTLEIGKLPALKFDLIQRVSEIKRVAFFNTPGYCIAYEKIQDLLQTFTSASYALLQASHSKHEGIYSDKPGLAQLWVRKEFAKNAIIWYNSCYDFILQIIYFGFDFWKSIDTPEAYAQEMGNCKFSAWTGDWCQWEKLKIKSFNLLAGQNDEAGKLYGKLTDFYHKGGEKKNNILKWANILKHRGGLNFDGIYAKPNFKVIFKNQLDNSYARPLLLKIDDVIEELISEHKKIVTFADYLYEFMELDTLEKLPNKIDLLNLRLQPQKFSAKQ